MANDLFYTHKRNFTAGELGSIVDEKLDFPRYINGCHELLNMVAKPQGPATRREGLEYLYDLTTLLGGVVNDVKPLAIPFVYSRTQAYVLVFFKHTGTSLTRVAFVTRDGLVETSVGSGVPYVFEFTGVMDIEEMDYAQSNDVLKIVQSGRKPVDFARTAHATWTATEISATLLTTDWTTTSDWPTRVGFFEQRIVMAANSARPQTLWFSRSGDFEDFVLAVSTDADPLALTLNSGSQNAIEWLVTARVLLIGTLGDEWAMSGKGSEPLSFESFSMVRHTQQGSENIKPIMIGPSVIFVEHLGRTVSQLEYNYTTDSYGTIDLSILAPHLTKRNKIIDWAYQKTPDGVIWSVRDDGVALGLTMKREHNVIGWHRHITDGSFLSFAAIPGDYETDLFAVVSRTIGGVTKWYIEVKSSEFVSDDASDCKFLDSYLEYDDSTTPISTVNGLSHLEGKTVSILADGRPHPDREVDSGSVTLDNEYTHIVVGLPYTSRVTSTPPLVKTDEGYSHGRSVDTIEAFVSIKDSAGFVVGLKDADNDEVRTVITTQNPDDEDGEPANLVTRIIDVDIPCIQPDIDASRIQRIFIEQTQPLPLTVLGIVEKVYLSEV